MFVSTNGECSVYLFHLLCLDAFSGKKTHPAEQTGQDPISFNVIRQPFSIVPFNNDKKAAHNAADCEHSQPSGRRFNLIAVDVNKLISGLS
jgi:hypothetical protein